MKSARQHILCIDDNASRNLAIYLLERVGFEVITANSITDGIELAQTQWFDLYLLNHTLLDAREVDSCEQLDKAGPGAPILFYSSVLYPYEPIRAIHCRRHNHMLKPVSVCDVQGSAARLIRERRGSDKAIQHVLRKASVPQFSHVRGHSP